MLNESTKSSDIEIIHQVTNGHINAFETLVKKYGDFVLRIVKRHVPHAEIEDVTQNAFLRVYKSLSMYKGKGNFKSWLSSIIVRTCYDYWRKAYKSREISMNALTENHQKWLEQTIALQSLRERHEKGLKKEASEILEWALNKLPPEDRMLIELIYLEGYSGKEAAKVLGWSVSNVKVRSFRLKRKLKSILNVALKKS